MVRSLHCSSSPKQASKKETTPPGTRMKQIPSNPKPSFSSKEYQEEEEV
jgi:hypothetical protein